MIRRSTKITVIILLAFFLNACEKQPSRHEIGALNERLNSFNENTKNKAREDLERLLVEFPDSYWLNLLSIASLNVELPVRDCDFDLNNCPSISAKDKKRLVKSIKGLVNNLGSRELKHEFVASFLILTSIGEHDLAVKYFEKFFKFENLPNHSLETVVIGYFYAHSLAVLDRRNEADAIINQVRSLSNSPQLDWVHLRYLENFYGADIALEFVDKIRKSGKFDRPIHDELCDFYGRQSLIVDQEQCELEFTELWLNTTHEDKRL